MEGKAFSSSTAMTDRHCSHDSAIVVIRPLTLRGLSRLLGEMRGQVDGASRHAFLQREASRGQALLCDGRQFPGLAHAHRRGARAFLRLGDAILVVLGSPLAL